jgi:hypothetical protein
VFLAKQCQVTTCPNFGQPPAFVNTRKPASCAVTTCFAKHVTTCLVADRCFPSLLSSGCSLYLSQRCGKRDVTMTTHELKGTSGSEKPKTTPKRGSKQVTEARARAQRAKLDTQKQERAGASVASNTHPKAKGKGTQRDLQAKRRAATTIARAVEDYLQDHEGGNHSDKTLEWHKISLGLMQTYLEQEREITLVGEIDAPDISGWFSSWDRSGLNWSNLIGKRSLSTTLKLCLVVVCQPPCSSSSCAILNGVSNAIFWFALCGPVRRSLLFGSLYFPCSASYFSSFYPIQNYWGRSLKHVAHRYIYFAFTLIRITRVSR